MISLFYRSFLFLFKALKRAIFLNAFLIWIPILFISFPAFARDPKMDHLSRPPQGEILFPPVVHRTLLNGMEVYLLEDHELPLVQAMAFVRGGSVRDPEDRVGAGALLGSLLRTGGTKNKPVEEIDRLLEDRGASIETGMSGEYGTAGLQCISKDYPLVLSLFFEILSSPQLNPNQLEKARLRQIEALRRVRDYPEKIAMKKFPKLIYGEKNIWARSPSEEELKKIRREDLLKFHDRFYHPDRTILAIAGDFKIDELVKKLETLTAGWPPAKEALPELPKLKKEWETGVTFIPKSGDQSTVLIGHLGDQRFNSDKFALILMNYLLGGDIFSSRLGEEVRSNRGLAYSVFSHFGLETDYGIFFAMAQTRSESTAEVTRLVQSEIGAFQQGKNLSESQLQFAKDAILNQMAGDWDPRFNYVKERARLALLGYPENYFSIYRKALREVTLAQVKDVARRYLFPERMRLLIVGDPKKLKDSLHHLGPVETISPDQL